MDVDFSNTAIDYARHRVGFPEAFYTQLAQEGLLEPGSRALDLGTGTGLVARELATRGLEVLGVDRAGSLLAQAARLDATAGVTVRYLEASAEAMGLVGEAFELVIAGQCWHWFDRPRVLEEIRLRLKPNGHLVIAHFDWLPEQGNVVEATESLILKYSPGWELGGGTGRYPQWLPGLATEGFRALETGGFDGMVCYSHEAWRGRIRASAGVAASLPPTQVEAFDQELKRLLESRYKEDPLQIPHRMWWVKARSPGWEE